MNEKNLINNISFLCWTIYFIEKARKDGENRILRMLDDKFNVVRTEIGRESKSRNENIDQLNQCLEVFKHKLYIYILWTLK